MRMIIIGLTIMAVNPTTESASGGWNEREDIATDMAATDETTKKENSVPFPLFRL